MNAAEHRRRIDAYEDVRDLRLAADRLERAVDQAVSRADRESRFAGCFEKKRLIRNIDLAMAELRRCLDRVESARS